MLSVIIPSYKDPLLQKTIDSLLENAEGDIEIIPILDGFLPDPSLKEDKRVKIVYLENNQGMRGAINAGLERAMGEFVMKIDSHCIVAPGYDRIKFDCAPNWLMIPRRYSLDEVNWVRNEGRPVRDYHYYSFPQQSGIHYGMFTIDWLDRTHRYLECEIDNTMSFQGSCWLANKKYFMEHVGF